MKGEQKGILEVNVIKGYYKKTFTNELLHSLQNEINVEDLLYSYNYYSHLLTGDDKFDNEEMGSEYLKSEDELEESPPSHEDKKYKVRKEDSDEDMINYFDPTITEELYEEKIEQTFQYLDNFLKAFYVPNDMNKSSEMEIINDVVKNLVIEKINNDEYKILDMQCEKSQIYEITLIIIAYIIRNIFSLSLGRKIIFSNKKITSLLLRALYKQNIYIQIFTLKNLKKYIMEDGECLQDIHLKMIKICIFSKSLSSFNRSNEMIQFLVKENKHVSEIFDFCFLEKLKKSLEHSDNVQRLRLLDLISECANINSQQICDIFRTKKKKKNMTQEDAEQDGGTSDQGENEETHTGDDVPPATTDTDDDVDVNLENFTYDSEYEEEKCTYDDISFVSKNVVEEEMKKHNVKLSQICKMIKINVYKYLYMIYQKDDLLLKINVLEIFSKFVQNEYYSDSTVQNCYFLHTVLNDLHNSNDDVLPLSILNSLICYAKINSALLHFIITAHDNILIKTIIHYLTKDSTHGSSSNMEKLIVGIKSFGYFFSLKESSEALVSLNPNAHLIIINNINTHSHTNVLKHAINIWIKILPAECMGAEWNKQLIHDVLFQKLITILKEIEDEEVQINTYQVLRAMVPYSIVDLIIQEHWLLRTLRSSLENKSYELKMSRYNFFKELYELNGITITNDAFSDNLISNFLEKEPKRY
ncbi:hypothetical protein C922_05198 [Plasmodium inui San Antonio 1]|uniref:Uncharacterized protein n=1 Tax=Plasmodium inui San Antonio 1 TaxID=1237626 RepID=W6ZYJ5_9APIC|nr:hypothetical protein C922_05198 [Plasmodium inui San Antonio 1]EUD64423.1 hypothetical protein C922_05198 [Plasmodium inui San Antonio 1]